MTYQEDVLELLRANDGALCIGEICKTLPGSPTATRARLRKMERAGLVAIDNSGRRRVTVGYADGSLVTLNVPAGAPAVLVRVRA